MEHLRILSPIVWRDDWPLQMGWTPEKTVMRLEQWHRAWEIANADKLVHPTFASERDLNHEHVWVPISKPDWAKSWQDQSRCQVCLAVALHDDPAHEHSWDENETYINGSGRLFVRCTTCRSAKPA